MADLVIDTREMKALVGMLHRAPLEAVQELQVGAYEATEILAAFLKESAPEFQGDLRSSIQGERASIGVGTIEAAVSAGVPYAIVQDVGRRSGKWPPEAPIRRWVQLKIRRGEIESTVSGRRGSLTGRGGRYRSGVGSRRASELRSIVYVIRRHIAEHGTKPTRYIDRGMRAAEPHVNAHLERLEARVAARIEQG